MKITGKTKEQVLQEIQKQKEIQQLLDQEKENFKKVVYILIKNSNLKLNKKLNKTEQEIIDKWMQAYEKLSKENYI